MIAQFPRRNARVRSTFLGSLGRRAAAATPAAASFQLSDGKAVELTAMIAHLAVDHRQQRVGALPRARKASRIGMSSSGKERSCPLQRGRQQYPRAALPRVSRRRFPNCAATAPLTVAIAIRSSVRRGGGGPAQSASRPRMPAKRSSDSGSSSSCIEQLSVPTAARAACRYRASGAMPFTPQVAAGIADDGRAGTRKDFHLGIADPDGMRDHRPFIHGAKRFEMTEHAAGEEPLTSIFALRRRFQGMHVQAEPMLVRVVGQQFQVWSVTHCGPAGP